MFCSASVVIVTLLLLHIVWCTAIISRWSKWIIIARRIMSAPPRPHRASVGYIMYLIRTFHDLLPAWSCYVTAGCQRESCCTARVSGFLVGCAKCLTVRQRRKNVSTPQISPHSLADRQPPCPAKRIDRQSMSYAHGPFAMQVQ